MFNNVSNITLLKVHWYKQPRHDFTRWRCQLAFRKGSPQCQFQMDLQVIRLSSLEQVWIFPFAPCSTFPHCLSSSYKGSPARWHVRASTSTLISSVLFPDSICFWISAENQVVDISDLYEGYVDGKFEDWWGSVTGTNSARWVKWWGHTLNWKLSPFTRVYTRIRPKMQI